MALGHSPVLRGVTLALLVMALQTSTLAEIRPAGAVFDIVAVLAVASGIVAGPQRGARAAFLFGLLFDSQLQSPFGIKALTYGLVAFGAGFLPQEAIKNVRLVRMGFMAAGCAVTALLEIVVAAVFGQDEAVAWRGVIGVVLAAVTGFVVGSLALRLMTWTLMAGDRDRR